MADEMQSDRYLEKLSSGAKIRWNLGVTDYYDTHKPHPIGQTQVYQIPK